MQEVRPYRKQAPYGLRSVTVDQPLRLRWSRRRRRRRARTGSWLLLVTLAVLAAGMAAWNLF